MRRLLTIFSAFSLIVCVATLIAAALGREYSLTVERFRVYSIGFRHGEFVSEANTSYSEGRTWPASVPISLGHEPHSLNWEIHSRRRLAAPSQTTFEPRRFFGRAHLESYTSESTHYGEDVDYCVLPWWLLAMFASIAPISAAIARYRGRRRARAGYCGHCGYDLRATPGRCPECGSVP